MTWDLSNGTLVVPEVADWVTASLIPLLEGNVAHRTPESSLALLRNRLAHGGGVTRTVAQGLLDIWREPLAKAVASLSWLAEISFVAHHHDGLWRRLHGPNAQGSEWSPVGLSDALNKVCRAGNEIVLVRGSALLPISPLGLFGIPRHSDPDMRVVVNPVAQIYVRRGPVRPQYTPVGSEELCQCEGDESAWDDFRRALGLEKVEAAAVAKGFQVRGFEQEIYRDAGKLVGRANEIARALAELESAKKGVLWLTGPAGIGKSYLVAAVAASRLDTAPEDTLILVWRFRAGDDRCSRRSFLRFVIERLQNWGGLEALAELDDNANEPDRTVPLIEQFRELAGRIPPGRRVEVIVDGLDEIAEKDDRFALEVPLRLRSPGLVWFCAGRPERGLPEVFAPDRARYVFPEDEFPNGLPQMGAPDIRTMLLEKIGPLRKRLLAGDRDAGDAVVNPFVDRVAEYAHGLPLYVAYVIGDILQGELRTLAADEALRLPPSLERYHERLLKRCEVGSLQQVLTPLVATLAISREALSPEALQSLLVRRTLVTTSDAGRRLVHSGLAALASMLRRALTSDGSDGFTLYHHSLRQHIETSETTREAVETARKAMADATLDWEVMAGTGAAKYVARHGIGHLVADGRRPEALGLLTRFDYLITRVRVLPEREGVRGVGQDWELLKGEGQLPHEVRIWEEFWRTHEHLLLSGDEHWPTTRILLQLALDHADTSPLSVAAETWFEPQLQHQVMLRHSSEDRPSRPPSDPCLFTLRGHAVPVRCCAVSANGAVAISGGGSSDDPSDTELLLWDLQRRAAIAPLAGHSGTIEGVAIDLEGRTAVSASRDRTVRVWRTSSHECLSVLDGHSGEVLTVQLAGDGSEAISGGADGRLVLWDVRQAGVKTILGDALGRIAAVSCDGTWRRAASGGDDGVVRFWDLQAGLLEGAGNEAHSFPITALTLSVDGSTAVSGDAGGFVRYWDAGTRTVLGTRQAFQDSVGALAITRDNQLTLIGRAQGASGREVRDSSIELWKLLAARRSAALPGHMLDVFDICLSADEQTAVTCSSDAEVRVWNLLAIREHREDVAGRCTYALAATVGGHMVTSGSEDSVVRIWDMKSRACLFELAGHPDRVLDVAYVGDQRVAVSGSEDGSIRMWDTHYGRPLASWQGHETLVDSVCPSPDGSILISAPAAPGWQASGVKDTQVRIWSLIEGRPVGVIEVAGENLTNRYVRLSPDGRLVVTALDDTTLALWRTEGGDPVRVFENPESPFLGWDITPNGRSLVAGHEDGTVAEWDLRSGMRTREFRQSPGAEWARGISVTPDSRLLFVGYYDPCVRVFNFRTGECVATAYVSGWVLGLRALGMSQRCAAALVNRAVTVLDLHGGPDRDIPTVTAARLWRLNLDGQTTRGVEDLTGSWDERFTCGCPWCGNRFELDSLTVDAVGMASRGLPPGRSPCLELADRAWQDPRLESTCSLCGERIRFNPFLVTPVEAV